MSDTLDRAKAGQCHAADTCVFDDACPFIVGCRAVAIPGLAIARGEQLSDAVSELLPPGYRFSYELTPILSACGKEIRYVTPLGSRDSEPCALPPDHEGDCDSPNLFLRPADAPKVWLP